MTRSMLKVSYHLLVLSVKSPKQPKQGTRQHTEISTCLVDNLTNLCIEFFTPDEGKVQRFLKLHSNSFTQEQMCKHVPEILRRFLW